MTSMVPDAHDRAFVARCIAREGPPHHQGSSYVILQLLAAVAERVGATAVPGAGPRPAIRLPPHHKRDEDRDDEFPIALPVGAVARIEGDTRRCRMLEECLLDGPSHHALANVAMVGLLDAILAQLDGSRRP